MEATDVSVPVLERLEFVSIFSSGLDEFLWSELVAYLILLE